MSTTDSAASRDAPVSTTPLRPRFDFEKLEVYQVAIQAITSCDGCLAELPTGRGYLRDQLRRAALSIANNIAEGAGEFSRGDKARFYRMARRSATECGAALGAAVAVGVLNADAVDPTRKLLARTVAMLTRLVQRFERGSG